MNRLLTWETRLVAWAETVRGQPFEWGRTDCVSLARQAIIALSGVDPVPDLAYTDLRGALRYLAERPFGQWLTEAGAQEVEGGPAFAQSGDLGVGQDPDHADLPAVAVVIGPLWVVTDQENGVRVSRVAPPWDARLYRFPVEAFVDG